MFIGDGVFSPLTLEKVTMTQTSYLTFRWPKFRGASPTSGYKISAFFQDQEKNLVNHANSALWWMQWIFTFHFTLIQKKCMKQYTVTPDFTYLVA